VSKYNFKIIKGDHPGDLHVHAYFNKSGAPFGKLLGKFRIPSLEPLSGVKHVLTHSEIKFLKLWLNESEQVKKLQDCLESTMFSSHDIAKRVMRKVGEGNIIREGGETFVTVKIPVIDRLKDSSEK